MGVEQPSTTRHRERGAVLIHVAIAIVALMAFSALIIDYGILWVARRQAQNSADAGALAGAVALTFDDNDDLTDSGIAKQSALNTALANAVWGAAPDVDVTNDIQFVACPDGRPAPGCIQVDVYRTLARGNPLPTFFGWLVGVTEQNVRARAIAEVMVGNSSDCLKPWAIPDKWLESPTDDTGPTGWSPEDTFDRYVQNGRDAGQLINDPDSYDSPLEGDGNTTTTGFTVEDDYGTPLLLKSGNPQQAIRPGWFFPVMLTDPGGDEYRDNIAGCAGVVYGPGDMLSVEPGNMIGPTVQGVEELIDQDPYATWSPTGGYEDRGQIIGGCMATGTCTLSPRVVALPIFDVDVYEAARAGGRTEIVIVNILGFFIEGIEGNDVRGRLINYPALTNGDYDDIIEEAAFAKVPVLVR